MLTAYATDDEAAEFEKIRGACLPEIVLAYNTILNFSNYYISRDVLVKSMDMATIVAAKDSDLGASFMAAGRMPELMDSLALSSRNMIQGEERGSRISKSKKKQGGETLDLWVVRAPPTSN